MPLQRSPPSGNTRTKTILKSSLLAAHRNDASSSHPTRVRDALPALQLPETISAESTVPTSVLSWSAQCLTPQLSVPPVLSPGWSASIVSTATSTTITTTYCSAMSTTTAPTFTTPSTAVSVAVAEASLMSLSSTTTTTSSSQPAAKPTLVSSKSHSSTTTTSSSEPAAKPTLAEKENSKRNRSSPNKNATVSNNKKQKVAQPIKSRQYWLGESPLSRNKYALLDTIDLDADNGIVQNADIISDNVVPSKPPPIYVQGVERIGVLQKALNNITELNYELQVLKNNEVKIVSANIDQYNSLIEFLNSKSTEYYTFKPKHLRGFKVVLRNMHYSTDLCDIKNELSELGHEVVHIQNMMHTHTKQPMSLFSIELKPKSNNYEIFSLNDLLHCKVKFEKPHKKRTPPQCTNCQKYGHTKNFCTKRPVCVKCAQEHKTSDCLVVLTRDQIKCALCGENHTSNYKGCRVFKSVTNKHKPIPTPLEHQSLAPRNVPPQGPIVVPGKSYADTVNNTPLHVNNQSDDIKELKIMVKQLLSQVSNMMTFMVTLLQKLNVSVAQ